MQFNTLTFFGFEMFFESLNRPELLKAFSTSKLSNFSISMPLLNHFGDYVVDYDDDQHVQRQSQEIFG